MENKLISIRAAAKALGIKPDALRQEIEHGKLPGVRIGDDILVSFTQIEAALLARTKAKPVGEVTP